MEGGRRSWDCGMGYGFIEVTTKLHIEGLFCDVYCIVGMLMFSSKHHSLVRRTSPPSNGVIVVRSQ